MDDWIARRALELDLALRPTVLETPLEARGTGVWAKQENLQTSGSFKIRGAMAKLLSLSDADRAAGVVAASTGNHGLATTLAGRVLGISVEVYVPETASAGKVAAIKSHGASVIEVPGDPLRAEETARAIAATRDVPFVSPYNDRHVIAGQATVGVELLRQIDPPARIIIAVGGGGLISGVASVISRSWPDTEIVGASPANSPAMVAAIEAGRIVEVPTLPTLSDGTAGGLEEGAITFGLCQQLVHRWLLVPEADIAIALDDYQAKHDDPIEGSAGVALAAAAQVKPRASTVVVLCGGNVFRTA